MNQKEILELAEDFMRRKNIDILLPGEIGEIDGSKVEVIFLDPDTMDPNVIVCPPDNRVWVNTETKEVTLIMQM